MTGSSDAWGKCAEDEATALAQLLESPTRKVLVVVIAHEAGGVSLTRAVSPGTTGADARGFVAGLDRERDRVASKLIRKAS